MLFYEWICEERRIECGEWEWQSMCIYIYISGFLASSPDLGLLAMTHHNI